MGTDRIRRQAALFLYKNNQANEAQLFQIVKGDLQTEFSGNLLGFGRIVPTKYRFHLYLRWCTQNDPTFLT
jgi:hypothetical protein